MLWKFIKTNWFTIALVVIVALAAARKGLLWFGRGKGAQKPKLEKYTELAGKTEGKSLFGLLPGMQGGSQTLPEISDEEAQNFLKRFINAARGEQKKFGMPASVYLGIAYVNSFAGKRAVAEEARNFFALTCSVSWDGGTADIGGRCYRRYETPWESFRDFSIYLTAQDWYGPLRKSAGRDWEAWVRDLDANAVSDVKGFRESLAGVIKAYRLYELDK